MHRFTAHTLSIAVALGCLAKVGAADATLPGTDALSGEGSLAAQTNAGWKTFLLGEIEAQKSAREKQWARDSPEIHREHLRRAIGAIDPRVLNPRLELIASEETHGPVADLGTHELWAVRWPTLEGVDGEGLLLRPKGNTIAHVILVPDADELPEQVARKPLVRRLAASGASIMIPALANRSARYTGDEALHIATNQSQREWIYRQGAVTGRHIIGYEVQKILAAIDALGSAAAGVPVGVDGYGEGGLLALHAAALDSRITSAWVAGYFQSREGAWREPLERAVWGALREFGDAEIAALVAPRALVVESSHGPAVKTINPKTGPVPGRSATPAEIRDASPDEIRREWERVSSLVDKKATAHFHLAADGGDALTAFWGGLSASPLAEPVSPTPSEPARSVTDLALRERRTVTQMQAHAQAQIRQAEIARNETFWKPLAATSAADWPAQAGPLRAEFSRRMGTITLPNTATRARSRLVLSTSTAQRSVYEVALEFAPGVLTWGCLLLPADLKPSERRPVVICQHGSGGLPADTFDENPSSRAFQIYQAYAARLAARGYVVFAPYLIDRIGGDDYRDLSRQANLLGLSLFSLMNASHACLLDWLRAQPFVDPARIALYGMSYGAKSAIRAGAALDGYAAVVLAGDFNDNMVAMSTVRYDRNECMFYPDYDLVEWNLADRFDYAELAALIAPRPFMVEFGYADHAVHLDGAAAEFAKVARFYHRLGVPDRAAIEFFEGGHTVPGRGTFEFLDRWLRSPPAKR